MEDISQPKPGGSRRIVYDMNGLGFRHGIEEEFPAAGSELTGISIGIFQVRQFDQPQTSGACLIRDECEFDSRILRGIAIGNDDEHF